MFEYQKSAVSKLPTRASGQEITLSGCLITTTAEGHFIELLVSNIIGYLAFLQNRHRNSFRIPPVDNSKNLFSYLLLYMIGSIRFGSVSSILYLVGSKVYQIIGITSLCLYSNTIICKFQDGIFHKNSKMKLCKR